MSVPKSSGGPPTAPLSTPAASSNKSPTGDHSAQWTVIPGLGSEAKHPTPLLSGTTSGAPPAFNGSQSVRTVSRGMHVPPMTIPPTNLAAPSTGVGVAPRTAGAPPTDWQKFMDNRGAKSAASTSAAVSASFPMSASSSAPRQQQGLSAANDNLNSGRPAPTNAKATTVKYTQTEEYHSSAASTNTASTAAKSPPVVAPPRGVAAPQTAPLPQTGFEASSNALSRSNSDQDESNFSIFTDPSSSQMSVELSEHYLKQHPEQADLVAPVWREAPYPRSIQRALNDATAEWEEPYSSALQTLRQLNPAQYVMPFGSRVVNIKTDFTENILNSIRSSRYHVMDKVAERIMLIWNARSDPREKVLFLFAVNSSKKFCGLAEMSGEWDPAGPNEIWHEDPKASRIHGNIPVTWIYAKDVGYSHLDDIRQVHNGHPVGNMWNGMNFPTDTGRQVIQRYVETASSSSILGFPRNYPENAGLLYVRGAESGTDSRLSGSQRGRGNFAQRGSLRGSRRISRGGLNIQNWRAQNSEVHADVSSYEKFGDDVTPTAANTVVGRLKKTTPPTFSLEDLKNAPPADNVTLVPGEPVSFVMGQDGRLMVVPAPAAAKSQAPRPSSSDQQGSVFGAAPSQSRRSSLMNPQANRGSMGQGYRNNHHPANSRALPNIHQASFVSHPEAAYPGRPFPMGPNQPPMAMFHPAALFAAQQEAQMQNGHHQAPYPSAWDYHAQQMASLGFQNNLPYRPDHPDLFSTQMREGNSGGYDEYRTPTHRPPPHASRDEANTYEEEDGVTPAYRSVPGWQSQAIQGMGHLQLKALFFTLAAEQHILEHLSMLPNATPARLGSMNDRMARIVDIKGEVAEELWFIGHTILDQPLDRDDFNPYLQMQHEPPRPYPRTQEFSRMPSGTNQHSISPLRGADGRRLPSVSETSRSPPDPFSAPRRPMNNHQQHSSQSAASMRGGHNGVRLG